MDCPQTDKHATHSLSPSKPPNATARSPFISIEPAFMRELFVNRFGGKDGINIDEAGDESSIGLSARYRDGMAIM